MRKQLEKYVEYTNEINSKLSELKIIFDEVDKMRTEIMSIEGFNEKISEHTDIIDKVQRAEDELNIHRDRLEAWL